MKTIGEVKTLGWMVASLLLLACGCQKLAKIHEIQQDLAVDRRGTALVMPLAATGTLCDIKFDEREVEGAKEYFRQEIRENLAYALAKEVHVIPNQAVDSYLQKQGYPPNQHVDKNLALKTARGMNAEIVVFGHVKVDPYQSDTLFEKTKRYDVDIEVYFFDVTNNDRLVTLRCAGQRKEAIQTIPWLIAHTKFHPPMKPPAKPAPKPAEKQKAAAPEKK